MKKVPFDYGSLADGDSFVNRVEERAQLKKFLSSGINVMLISPRRWGKSSLVRMALSELTKEDSTIRVCYIDAFQYSSEEEFLRGFASSIIRASSNALEQCVSDISKFLKTLAPKISFQSDPANAVSLDLTFNIKSLSQDDIDSILNLPEKIAVEKKIKLIVCIDEFQALAAFPSYKALESKMRSIWQTHKSATYCLYGSKRHMMNEIFNNAKNPFYRFGQVLFLKKIAKEEWVNYIVSGFKKAEIKIAKEIAENIAETVEYHSWYVQQLAFFTWSQTLGTTVSAEDFERAKTQLIDTNEPMFISDTEKLSASQLNLLRAIAEGETKFNSKIISAKYSLGAGPTIARNRVFLETNDFIMRDGDSFSFLDPVYKLWFKNKFNN